MESSDDDGGLPEAKAPRKEAVYDFSDTDEDDVEEMEKRLKKIEASVRRKQKVRVTADCNFGLNLSHLSECID